MSDSVRPHRQKPTRLPHPWDSPGKNTGVGCHFPLQCMKVKSEKEAAQSCLTPRDPMDCSLPGSSVHGIFQARVLEWGAIAFSPSTATEVYLNVVFPRWKSVWNFPDSLASVCQILLNRYEQTQWGLPLSQTLKREGMYFALLPFSHLECQCKVWSLVTAAQTNHRMETAEGQQRVEQKAPGSPTLWTHPLQGKLLKWMLFWPLLHRKICIFTHKS